MALLLAVLALTACEQPAVEAPAAAVEPASEQAAESAPTRGVKSIDADGNIAPFGFAARQPVEVAGAMPAAAPPTPTSEDSHLYATHCVACHGYSGAGVEGLGVNLLASSLVSQASDIQLVGFLQMGRPANAPDNVTGVPMPSFDWMKREELEELARYVKSLQGR